MKEEKKENPTAEFLAWIQATDKFSDNTIWSILSSIESEHPDDGGAVLEKLFGKEQAIVLKIIVKKIVDALEWHMREDDEPHVKTLGKDIEKLEAKFRNHRHDANKTYTAKPEW